MEAHGMRRWNWRLRGSWRGLGALAALALLTPAAQAETTSGAHEPEETVGYHTVTGLVSGLGPQFIAVEYERHAEKGEAFEMALPVDDAAKLERVKKLRELQLGDTVEVEYRETSIQDEQGDSTTVKRVATKIALVRSAPQEALSSKGDVAE